MLRPLLSFRDYCEGLRDSLDLVPIGAWYGQGRKTGWFSPFLLAAWDPEKEEYQSVCRCMSGFTDAFYTEVRFTSFPRRKSDTFRSAPGDRRLLDICCSILASVIHLASADFLYSRILGLQATERLTQTICERKPYYNTGEWPSVWFEPGEVWEIRGADLTISPVHRAAVGCIEANRERGVSLRYIPAICNFASSASRVRSVLSRSI